MRTLTISDTVFQAIDMLAKRRGQTPEDVIADLVAEQSLQGHTTEYAYDAYTTYDSSENIADETDLLAYLEYLGEKPTDF
jgi:hypothetical protein